MMRRLPRVPLSTALSVPSWATPWRARPASLRAGPTIAVVGNCQARGIAQSVEILVPDARVALFTLGRLRRDHASTQALARVLGEFDHVFTQTLPPGFLPPGDPGAMRALEARSTVYPTLVFAAFHPDMVYVGDLSSLAEAKLVPSPMGHYHSAIVLFAYLRGLDEAATAALFREEVFATLGYLDGWNGAAEDLLRTAAAIGFDLGADLRRWTRRGAFMHVFNHPRIHVLGDIARTLAARAGLHPADVAVEDYLGDDLLRDVVWPVYGPIAERYGIPGSFVFKAKARGEEPPVLYDLAAFVEKSFAIYRTRRRESLVCARLAAWEDDAGVRALFGA